MVRKCFYVSCLSPSSVTFLSPSNVPRSNGYFTHSNGRLSRSNGGLSRSNGRLTRSNGGFTRSNGVEMGPGGKDLARCAGLPCRRFTGQTNFSALLPLPSTSYFYPSSLCILLTVSRDTRLRNPQLTTRTQPAAFFSKSLHPD